MGRGAQSHDRLARFKVIDKVFHLIIRQLTKPGKQNHQISILYEVHPFDIGLVVGIDGACGIIHSKQHRAVKSVSH